MGEQSSVRYHYSHRCFTYLVSKELVLIGLILVQVASAMTLVNDIVRWGVWLGRHIC